MTYALLRRLLPAATWTIVGDMGQSIRAGHGLENWQEALSEIGERTVQKELRISYRNTVEIMTLANHVQARRPYPGQTYAEPVLRHGPKPDLTYVRDEKQQTAQLCRLIDKYISEGFRSIAMIVRTDTEARTLIRRLPGKYGARYLQASRRESLQGVTVFTAESVKGLEFDCVILPDVSETSFRDVDMEMRLLYVILTRALHRLSLLCSGKLSPLLSGGPMESCPEIMPEEENRGEY